MATNNSILVFKCLNSDCGQMIKLPRPSKSGVYNVTCPHCKVQKKLKLKGLDAFPNAPVQNANISAPQGNSQATVSNNSANPPIEIDRVFFVGESYKFECPHCHKQELGMNPQKDGHKEFACPLCHGKIALYVRRKTNTIAPDFNSSPMIKGKLVLLRKGWLNKDYHLVEGKQIVGRFDENEVSDIAIKGDSSMSRQSIEIAVIKTSNGYKFKMTVLKAKNPVLLNNKPLTVGESLSLNFGDSITLGRTKFRFDQDK